MSRLIPIIKPPSDDMNELSSSLTNLVIPNNSFNNVSDMTELNLNRFYGLESIKIGDSCFKNVQKFEIDGLDHLKTINIGKYSFTEITETDLLTDWDASIEKCWNESKSFHILNCQSLKSLEVGMISFADFAGDFELDNLEKLETIKIGDIGKSSLNFYWTSFVVQSNTIVFFRL